MRKSGSRNGNSQQSSEELSVVSIRYSMHHENNAIAQHSLQIDNNLDELLLNPIKCGYLHAFCLSEYSAENLNYLIEVDRFRDLIEMDIDAWNVTINWKDIDGLLNIHSIEGFKESKTNDDEIVIEGESQWPSRKVPFSSVREHILKIWKEFISYDATTQICIPSKVLCNTRKRLENLHLYGAYVLEETLLDPMKTLTRDTLPRFLSSNYYKRMGTRLDALYPLPEASSLELPLPGKAITATWPIEDINVDKLREMSLSDMFHDRIIYPHFVTYCKKLYCDENAYCGRALTIYQCHYKHAVNDTTCPPGAEDIAWTIFRYFIAPKSCYEVSLSHRRRKEIMRALANPPRNVFSKVELSAFAVLKGYYQSFSRTDAFQELPALILKRRSDSRNVIIPVTASDPMFASLLSKDVHLLKLEYVIVLVNYVLYIRYYMIAQKQV